jgi:hypothetical protein
MRGAVGFIGTLVVLMVLYLFVPGYAEWLNGLISP